jgi:hypothetical protein
MADRKKTGCLAKLLALFLLGGLAIWGIKSCGDHVFAPETPEQAEKRKQEEATQSEKRQQEEAERAEKEKAAAEAAKARLEKGMGETLSIGYTSYAVRRAHWSDRLSSNPFLDKRPNAKWLFVEVAVRNNDKKARMIPPFKLEDEQGREYESSAEATMIENAIGVLDSLNPDVTKQGYVVFDVPPDRIYKLKLSGGYWSTETGYIRIEPTGN